MSDEVETERVVPPAPADRVISDRYVLRTELGRGGMGIVWRGEDRVLGRPVAVKEMRLGEGVSAEERAEFEQRIMREARIAGRLNDPAVVTVYDVVHDNGSVFIVMELVEAPTLSQLVRRSGPLEPQAVADIGRQVLSALEAAHAAGIVHRDVKPSNIMVGANGRAKLTDFGIAQAADDPTLTKTGAVIGSPAYLAPERLSGQEASPASDLWSLGAVLYFAIEGRAAFERDTTAATLGAVLNDVPYLTNVQGPLAAAISGMLAAAPEGRLTVPRIRTLLNPVANDGTRVMPQGTTVMPAGGWPTATMSAVDDPVSPAPAAGRRRRSWLLAGGAIIAALALITGGVASSVAFYHKGYNTGASDQTASDVRPADAVQVYTVGGTGADFPALNLNSGYTCLSGPAFVPSSAIYQNGDCSKPHDLEIYYQTDLLNSSYSNGNGPSQSSQVGYPGTAELSALAQQLCWTDRSVAPWAAPKDSHYSYYALIPSQNLWTGQNLPSGWNADDKISCLMTNASGLQLPGDVSH